MNGAPLPNQEWLPAPVSELGPFDHKLFPLTIGPLQAPMKAHSAIQSYATKNFGVPNSSEQHIKSLTETPLTWLSKFDTFIQ